MSARSRRPFAKFCPRFVDSRCSTLCSVEFRPRFVATLRPRFARFHPRFVGCFVLLSARFRSGRVDSRGSALDSQGCILDSSIRQISSSISTVIESNRIVARFRLRFVRFPSRFVDSRGSILYSSIREDPQSVRRFARFIPIRSMMHCEVPPSIRPEVPLSIREVPSSIRRFARIRTRCVDSRDSSRFV